MGKMFPTVRPFQRLFIDLLGPYPRSKAGNTTILILLDQLTKFVLLKPLRKATTIAVVRFLESEMFHVFGTPETILSDNGVQFVSKEFQSLLARYGVQQICTGTHAPQANAAERVNRSILSAVRSYVENDQTNWDIHLSAIASSLRNSVHTTLGCSPYFAVFGNHMVQHAGIYNILRNLESLPSGEIEVIATDEWNTEFNAQIRKQLEEAHDRNTRVYNTRSKEVSFRYGQEVFRRSFEQSNFRKTLMQNWRSNGYQRELSAR